MVKGKVIVGDKFILKDGEEVEVVGYTNCEKVTVSTLCGMVFSTTASLLRRRKVSLAALQIKVGYVFSTLHYGLAQVLELDTKGMAQIRFIDTGFEYRVRKTVIPKGNVRDYSVSVRHKSTEKYKIGSRWVSKRFGEFTIDSVRSCADITVIWDNSGYTQSGCNSTAIISGSLQDNSRSRKNIHRPKLKTGEGHYVYFVKLDGEVVYIGKGAKDRYKHVYSGRSHNYDLNRLHFSGVVPELSFEFSGLSPSAALKEESRLISEIKPLFNIAGIDYRI